MSEYEWEDDQNQATGPKGLREYAAKAKEENQKLKTQLDALNAKVRQQEVTGLLTSHGVPEKAMNLFPKDIDPTVENVSKWVADYGDLFGKPTPGIPQTEATPEVPVVSPEQKSAFEQISNVTSGAMPTSSNPVDRLKVALANPNLFEEMPHEEFKELLKAAGAKV